MSASIVVARGNRIFPVETFGDTLIVSPKGEKSGFGEADFRVECGRVSAALRDPFYKNLVLDFSLTNYVGGNVVEELQKWVADVREQGGRAVACEVSDDMRKGLEVSRIADDWEFFETRDDALKTVATETFGQTASRWAPTVATVVTVLLLVGLGAWLLTGRHEERRRFLAVEEIWKDYAKLQAMYVEERDLRAQTPPLVERLDAEIDLVQHMMPSKYTTRNPLLSTARNRMRPILLDPHSPDSRIRGVEAGLAYVRANLENVPAAEFKAAEEEYVATVPRRLQAQAEAQAAAAAAPKPASTSDPTPAPDPETATETEARGTTDRGDESGSPTPVPTRSPDAPPPGAPAPTDTALPAPIVSGVNAPTTNDDDAESPPPELPDATPAADPPTPAAPDREPTPITSGSSDG